MAEKVLMKGNEAIAEAAIRAGCRHFFGYPITDVYKRQAACATASIPTAPPLTISEHPVGRKEINWETENSAQLLDPTTATLITYHLFAKYS